jgi:hypothetical protein
MEAVFFLSPLIAGICYGVLKMGIAVLVKYNQKSFRSFMQSIDFN